MDIVAWCLRHGPDLDSRQWDQDLLVWHRRCGDTHLLTGLAARVFLHLRQGSATTAALQCGVAGTEGGPGTPVPELEATLRDLMRLGLVSAQPT